MIDISKMKALAMKVGGVEWYEAGDSVSLPDGDTIACCQSSIGHMPEPIHYDDMVEYLVSVSPAKILSLLSELEAREADRRDADRYRLLRRGQHWSVWDAIGDTLRADALDAAIDAALAQRQGEDDERA
ncbi:hypothetical protein [Burkholderia vietnamiensis]|uniref:hypothetical protein n=1 Tax=Burkholderia vietnamiensis TaxID=60552 RepID=UPI001CF3248D|nr:hypothetical protein [Burkholderia vietnamiensis]MCA8073151.1 hypothetical protein [Burkholderia vietnamiensis]